MKEQIAVEALAIFGSCIPSYRYFYRTSPKIAIAAYKSFGRVGTSGPATIVLSLSQRSLNKIAAPTGAIA